jgi:hypothetical protein
MRDLIAYCAQPARLRWTATTAVIVGTVLTLVNQGDVIATGAATWVTAVKIGANYLIPFIVGNIGLLAGRGQGNPPPA